MKAKISFNSITYDLDILTYSTNGSTITMLTQDGKSYTTGVQNVLIIGEFVKPSL